MHHKSIPARSTLSALVQLEGTKVLRQQNNQFKADGGHGEANGAFSVPDE